ncbi:MAG: hypothetical protein JRF72_22530 [Deltaproteobacteria bacterium]|jgi:hypothetical protein|nr:hypothetical protein [Deltaproteobacteria bacterium]
MKKLVPVLICVLFIFSCVSAAQQRSLNDLPEADFSVDIPDGWWKPKHTGKYLLTKDGPYLQYVLIQQRPLNKSFRYTKKKINAGMLPQEAAGIIIDELASDRYLMNFRVIENTPANVGGHAGFKVRFTYEDKKKSAYQTLYYGFNSGNFFYNIRYCAAARHYYEKDLASFEHIVNSFELAKD